MQEVTLTKIVSIIGGGALFKFLEFLINRKDNRIIKRIDELEKSFNGKIEDLRHEFESESANNARIRILTFSEEIQRGHKHSKESFDQIHSDIDDYLKYCHEHPNYPNSRADMAIKNIEDVYLKAMKKESDGKEGFIA